MTSGSPASRSHSDSPFVIGFAWFTAVIVSSRLAADRATAHASARALIYDGCVLSRRLIGVDPRFGGSTVVKRPPLRENDGVRSPPRVIAWCLGLAALVVVAGGLVLDRIAAQEHVPDSGSVWLYPFLVAAVSAPAVLGALIVGRQARNPVGWILVVGALSLAVVLAASPYAWVALDAHPGSLPGGSWAALVSSLWPVFFAWPLAVAFVFPDGRLPSRRWRPYALFAVGSMTLLAVVLVLSDELEEPFSDVSNPFPLRLPEAVGFLRPLAWLSVFASLFVGAAAVRVRYGRSKAIERLQMLWLACAALLLPLGVLWFLVWRLAFGEAGAGDAVVGFLLGMEAAVAIAVGVAVRRYRLYEIDRLINRTLVYSAVSVSLGLLYGLVSLLAGVALGRGSTWVTALAVLVVAAAFGPLRSRAQAAVDWRFDRPRYEGLRRVRAFADDVREGRREPEDVGAVLAAALRDPSAELLFRLPASDAYADRLGTVVMKPVGDERSVTRVEHRGQEIGLLRHNRALLARPDLLRSVLAAASLAIEIARLRVEVRLQLAEVEESRARVVRAGYEERRRLERDLHDGAQQRLVTLGIVLRRLQRSLPREAQILGPALGSAVDEVGRAIEDLRTIAAGVRPPRLDEGLAAALADLARAAPVRVDVQATDERLPEEVEAAAYFVVCEAVTNAVKHGSPSQVRVDAMVANGTLRLVVVDDGSGGATPTQGTGLAGLSDRVEAQGGTLLIHSPVGAGTRIEVEIPCGS
jgi:signal transduction histidine kinase